jgi:hypothetical protein
MAEAERARKRAIAKPYIPEAKDIDKIVAEVYDHQLTPFFPDIGPFEIPREDYEKVFHYFRNAQLDERLPSSVSVEMGTIRFIMKEGGGFRICWFWVGKGGRLAFSWNGIRYRSAGERFAFDETMEVDAVVREIHDRITKTRKENVPPSKSGEQGKEPRQ